MRASEKEKLISKHMSLLGISREEAEQLIADDEAIDKGAKLFELTPEQEKASKKARQADRKPTVYNLDNTGGKRSKKADDDKAELLKALLSAVSPMCETYEVTNAEREFVFTYNERKFKVTLSAPRS